MHSVSCVLECTTLCVSITSESTMFNLACTLALLFALCYGRFFFFFSSRRRHTRFDCDWSSDVCSSDLYRDRFPARGNTGIGREDPPGQWPGLRRSIPLDAATAHQHAHARAVFMQQRRDRKSVV